MPCLALRCLFSIDHTHSAISYQTDSLVTLLNPPHPKRARAIMDFLKKAKAKVAELENDLNKATASLGLGGKEGAGSGLAAQAPMAAAPDTSSSFSTPATSTANTPSTSVAPSSAPDAPKTKLPMAVRKDGKYRPSEMDL